MSGKLRIHGGVLVCIYKFLIDNLSGVISRSQNLLMAFFGRLVSASYQDPTLDEEVGLFGRKFRDSLRPEFLTSHSLNYSTMLMKIDTSTLHMATKSSRRYMEIGRGSKKWED